MSVRRSSRIHVKEEAKVQAAPSRSKPKAGQQSRKKQKRTDATAEPVELVRNGPRVLDTMPVEILYEIFSRCHPKDLMYISRTCKALRQLLLQRSAILVWKQAYDEDDDIPECPPDQSHPAWTYLLYEPCCHVCLEPRVGYIMFALRMRACRRCLHDREVFADSAEEHVRKLGTQFVNHKTFPRTIDARTKTSLVSELDANLEGCREAMNSGLDVLEKFIAAKRREIWKIHDHAAMCFEWLDEEKALRSDELADIRETRVTDIKERLVKLGHEVELTYILTHHENAFYKHTQVKRNEQITEQTWPKVKQEMLKLIATHKPLRLLHNRKELVTARCHVLKGVLAEHRASHPGILPSNGDLAQMPALRAIWDAPASTTVTAASFLPALAGIPAFTAAWRETQNARLLAALARGDPPVKDPTPAHLALARTWFFCGACGASVHHPEVLAHRCASSHHQSSRWWVRGDDDVLNAAYLALGSVAWNASGVLQAPRPTARAAAEWAVRACGLDPAQATAKEMDDVGAVFFCDASNHNQRRVGWRQLVAHDAGGYAPIKGTDHRKYFRRELQAGETKSI